MFCDPVAPLYCLFMPLQMFVCEFSCACFCVWYLVRLLLFFLLVSPSILLTFFSRWLFSSFVLLRIFYFFSRACAYVFVCFSLCLCMWEVFCYFHHRVGLMWFSFVVYYPLFFTIDVQFIIRFFSNWMSRMNFMLRFECVCVCLCVLCSSLKLIKCEILPKISFVQSLSDEPRDFSIRNDVVANVSVSKIHALHLVSARFVLVWFGLFWCCCSAGHQMHSPVLEILLRLVGILHALAQSQSIHAVMFSIWSVQFSSCAIILTNSAISFVPCTLFDVRTNSCTSILPKFLSTFHIIEGHS